MQLVSKQARTRNIVAVTTKVGGVGTLCLLSAGLMGSHSASADAPIALAPPATFAPQSSPLISLDFTRAAVSDILTMIGREGNVDIIIGEDVTGTLKSVHLTDKTADQAIRMVAQSSGVSWKKLDARTYMVGQAAGSSTQSVPAADAGSSQENMAVPDPSGPSGLAVPLLKPQSKSVDESSTMAAVDLRNVKPTIMAYWLDPTHQPKPIQFQKSDERAKYEGDRYKNLKSMSPTKLMERQDDGDSASNSSPQTPQWAQPGSGYLPFNPYTQSQRQTGGNLGGGNTGGGGGGGAGGGTSGNQDILASGAATVALPAGVDNIIAIDAQNVLLVRGTDEGLDRIREIISVLDRPIPQVEIETRFVQITTQDANTFGISFTRIPGQTVGSGTTVIGNPQDVGGNFTGGIAVNFTSGQVNVGLQAAINQGRAKVVNAPRVTTFNNLTAQVVSINTIVIPTQESVIIPNGIGTPIVTTRTIYTSQVSGVVLTAIPTVNRDGTITLSLQPLVLTAAPSTVANSPFPDISSQEINTSANIKDGDTLAIGGLRTLQQRDSRGRIPILGSLPIIGPLFRSRDKRDLELELVIFVTAHIVRNINDPVAGT